MADLSNQPGAIVIGIDCITGLQSARALHRHGVRVTGIAFDPSHFANRTRCVSKVVLAKRDGANLADCLRTLATSDRPVLMPTTDTAVSILARYGPELSKLFRIANPHGQSIERGLGKVPFARHAAEHGIPVPRTRAIETLQQIRRATSELNAPFVLKPDIKSERWMKLANAKVLLAEDGAALERTWVRCRDWSERFVVQEWVEGGDEALYSYYSFISEDRRIVAECVGHKVRQWPRLTGSGTLSELCDDPEICQTGRAVLESLDHRGFATINMKRDSETGRLFVIEANLGRPGMGMFVAEAGGIEMTSLAYRSLVDLPLPSAPTARYPNARWVSLKRDLAAAFAAWRKGELGMAAYLRSLRGVRRTAVFDLRDPVPFLYDVMRLPGQLARRRLRSEESVILNRTAEDHHAPTRVRTARDVTEDSALAIPPRRHIGPGGASLESASIHSPPARASESPAPPARRTPPGP